MKRRQFVANLAGGAAGAILGFPNIACGPKRSTTEKKVIVLGLDGLDPKIVGALIDTGRAPNFKRLAEMGGFRPLQTTMPALSPVAWSSFITGLTPGGHGIADFIVRDPETYMPFFSIWEARESGRTLSLGDYQLPLGGGEVVNRRVRQTVLGLPDRARHPRHRDQDADQCSRPMRPPPAPSAAWEPQT